MFQNQPQDVSPDRARARARQGGGNRSLSPHLQRMRNVRQARLAAQASPDPDEGLPAGALLDLSAPTPTTTLAEPQRGGNGIPTTQDGRPSSPATIPQEAIRGLLQNAPRTSQSQRSAVPVSNVYQVLDTTATSGNSGDGATLLPTSTSTEPNTGESMSGAESGEGIDQQADPTMGSSSGNALQTTPPSTPSATRGTRRVTYAEIATGGGSNNVHR